MFAHVSIYPHLARMRRQLSHLLTVISVLSLSGTLFAHHPSEGSLTLSDLLKEAGAQNLEIQEVAHKLQAAQDDAQSRNAGFLPKLSLEGGPAAMKLDGEKHSGTTLYGLVEWDLYQGGRTSAEVQKANTEVELTKRRLAAAKSRVSREISQVYYELLFALEGLALSEKALSMNEDQMKIARLKRSAGLTSPADVIEFELRQATLKSELKLFAQTILNHQRHLAVILGRSNQSPLPSVKGHLTRDHVGIGNRASILARLVDSNLAIAESTSEAKISQQDLTIARAGHLPTVGLQTKYGKLANEEKVFTETDNFSMQVKITIPLFSGLEATHQIESAHSRAQAAEIATLKTHRAIEAEANSLFEELDTISERLTIEEQNLAKSEEYYQITMGEYKRGVKNSPDMVGASERLLEARIRNLQYRRDYHLTKLKIFGLTESLPAQE